MSDLAGEVGTLVRQELGLARAEIAEKAKEAKGAAAKVGVGSAVLHAGALTLAATCVLGLTLLLRTWMAPLAAGFLSALVVGAVLAAVGYTLVKKGGKDLSPAQFVPRKALDCLKEDARWAKERIV